MGVLMKQGVNYSGGTVKVEPIIYSEDEREVGVWIDGRPLYEKTVTLNPVGSSGTEYISMSANEMLIDAFGITSNQNFRRLVPLAYRSNSGSGTASITETICLFQRINENRIEYVYNGVDVGTAYVTLRYIKTTDTAGGGLWSTTGEPAHHYSQNEQVVGTWIDGKPVYEKTLIWNGTLVLSELAWTEIPFTNVPSMDYCAAVLFTTDCIFDNRVRLKIENGVIKGATSQSGGQNVYSITLTFQYTKTTD